MIKIDSLFFTTDLLLQASWIPYDDGKFYDHLFSLNLNTLKSIYWPKTMAISSNAFQCSKYISFDVTTNRFHENRGKKKSVYTPNVCVEGKKMKKIEKRKIIRMYKVYFANTKHIP